VTDSSVEDFDDPEMMSKKDVKRCRISESELGMSVRRTMLLTSVKETKTYRCCVLYACDGSERAGRIAVINSVKIS
jgi:hypothetical protein